MRGMSGVGSGGSARGGFAAPLSMQLQQLLPEFEADALPALPRGEVPNVRLAHMEMSRDLVLREPRVEDVGNDSFPHAFYDSTCCCISQQHQLVQQMLSDGYSDSMEIDGIRRLRLRAWIDHDPHSNGDVEAWCGHYSQFIPDDERPLNPTIALGKPLIPLIAGLGVVTDAVLCARFRKKMHGLFSRRRRKKL